MFFNCKSLFLSLKLHDRVLKVKNINAVYFVIMKAKIGKQSIYMLSSTVYQCPYA